MINDNNILQKNTSQEHYYLFLRLIVVEILFCLSAYAGRAKKIATESRAQTSQERFTATF